MATISAEAVKVLRERTGAGFMDCKRVLDETDGDVDKAIALLRERGLAAAAKKAGRDAREGLVSSYIHTGGRVGVMIEVNCETDFVARTDEFQKLVRDLAIQVAGMAPTYVDLEAIPAEDHSIDVLFLLEVVEHLGDDVLAALFPEMRRVLKLGGHVVLTTPNNERLGDMETVCPNCGCLFHTMQHVRSWNAKVLGETLAAAGFEQVLCEATLFSRFRNAGAEWLQRVNNRLRRRQLPHLMYIGRSPR